MSARLRQCIIVVVIGVLMAMLRQTNGDVEADTVFYLPWRGGQTWYTSLGNCGDLNSAHSCDSANKYAWDFYPMGSASDEVVAVANGTVCYMQNSIPDTEEFPGAHAGNVIVIAHNSSSCVENQNGTYSFYAHLKQNSSDLKAGDTVTQGTVIVRRGQSGFAWGPHLHFSINSNYDIYTQYNWETAAGDTKTVSFADQSAEADNGIPRATQSYESSNYPGPNPQPDLKQVSNLSIFPTNPWVGQEVSFSFNVHNFGGKSITFQKIGPQGIRQGTSLTWDAFAQGIIVGPGETVQVSSSRSFLEAGVWSVERITYQDQADGGWYSLPDNGYPQAQTFEVLEIASTPIPPPTATPTLHPPVDCPGQWKGEYFNNRFLDGGPTVIRCDNRIDFDWPVSPIPGSGIPNDGFSVRWSRDIYFDAATFTFHLAVDDGGRLFIDGNQVIDAWQDGAERRYDLASNLLTDYHSIRLEYYENTGVAAVRLWWDEPNLICPGQWRGDYYNNQSLYSFPATFSRCDNAIDFSWAGSPAPGTGVPNDGFSIRWERDIYFNVGHYTFKMAIDDGGSLWIDNVLVMDHWNEDGAERWYLLGVDLTQGVHRIRMEQRENTGAAAARLFWEPVQVSCPDSWRGEYYNNREFLGFPATLIRCDVNIDFSWTGSPVPGSGVPNNGFSVRWLKNTYFDTGRYQMHLSIDDGARLFVDGDLLIESWMDGAERELTQIIDLVAGTHAFQLEYYENTGVAVARLWWERVNLPPNTPSLLSPVNGTTFETRLVNLTWQDNGDPDNYPQSYRDFWIELWNESQLLYINSGWIPTNSWSLNLPSDNIYHWQVRASDGGLSSGWSTARHFSVITPMPCYDFNGNGVIDIDDAQLIADHWRCNRADECYVLDYDLDQNGLIDVLDLMMLTKDWGTYCTR